MRSSVDAWLFAAGDPLGAAAGIRVLRDWGIDPLAISGVVSMSPLGMKEAQAATGLPCITGKELQSGGLNARLLKMVPGLVPDSSAAPTSVAACDAVVLMSGRLILPIRSGGGSP